MIEYRGIKFPGYNKPIKSNRPGKKKMVLAKVGDKVKLIHYGATGYSDYTKHKDPDRRARYHARHNAIKTKDGKRAVDNKLQAAYWSKKDLW